MNSKWIVASLAALAVCSGSPALAQAPRSDKPPAKAATKPEPVEHNYQAANKRDPFKNETEVVLPPALPTCGTLCEYGVEQFRIAALVTGMATPLAGLEAPNGKVYIVDRNTPIGKNGGRVIEVSALKVVVEEPCAKDTSRKCRTEIGGAKDPQQPKDEDLLRKK
jgi:type IV pilus assembly protein PilP